MPLLLLMCGLLFVMQVLPKKRNSNASTFFDKHTLNSHYCRISSLYPSSSHQQLTQLFNHQSDPTTQFSFYPVTEEFVRNKILTLSHKSNNLSPDGLPLKYLINIIDWIISPLTKIFNFALSSSIYSQNWKSAFIKYLNRAHQIIHNESVIFLILQKFSIRLSQINSAHTLKTINTLILSNLDVD